MLFESNELTLDILYAAGHRLIHSSRTLEAAEAFRALVIAAPRDERGWLGLSECHRVLGETWIALELLWVARLINRASARCAVARARILRELGRTVDADRALNEAAEHANGEAQVLALIQEERELS